MNYSCKAHKTEINVKAPGFSLFSQYLTPLCEVVCLLWKINWINTTVKLPVDLSITFRFSLSRESSVNSVNPQKCPGGASRGWRILLAVESITIFIYQAFCGFTSAVRIAFFLKGSWCFQTCNLSRTEPRSSKNHSDEGTTSSVILTAVCLFSTCFLSFTIQH